MKNELTIPVQGFPYSKSHACRLHEHGRKGNGSLDVDVWQKNVVKGPGK